jgi:hypothetical protein
VVSYSLYYTKMFTYISSLNYYSNKNEMFGRCTSRELMDLGSSYSIGMSTVKTGINENTVRLVEIDFHFMNLMYKDMVSDLIYNKCYRNVIEEPKCN